MNKRLEQIFAFYCAPTLAGAKSANLFSFYKSEFTDIKKLISECNKNLNIFGIYLDILHECNKKVLVLLYRKKDLWKELSQIDNKRFLQELGYDNWTSIATILEKLKKRFIFNCTFPHEIGMFLSYPLEDVIGFIKFKGKNYKYSGYWKIYHDEEITKNKFEFFTFCREVYCEQINSGKSIMQLIKPA